MDTYEQKYRSLLEDMHRMERLLTVRLDNTIARAESAESALAVARASLAKVESQFRDCHAQGCVFVERSDSPCDHCMDSARARGDLDGGCANEGGE